MPLVVSPILQAPTIKSEYLIGGTTFKVYWVFLSVPIWFVLNRSVVFTNKKFVAQIRFGLFWQMNLL